MLYVIQKAIKWFKRSVALALVMLLVLGAVVCPVAESEGSGTVRVKLTRLGSNSSISFTANCAYVLVGNGKMNIPSGTKVTVSASGSSMTVSCDGISVFCGSSVQFLRCGSGTSGISFKSPSMGNVFCGDLYLTASGGVITPILHIYIEDYLYGVVAYEMSNSYPLEALKAQAVAARNYVMRKMGSGSYHVTDTTKDQVFKGYNSGQGRVIQAVNETRGMALYIGGSLAACYYGASNGGQTESTKNAWGSSLSYSTVKDDPYDLEHPSAKKTTATIARNAKGLHASLEAALLSGAQKALGMDVSEIVSIDGITPCNPKYASPSRLYKTLTFKLQVRTQSGLRTVNVNVDTYGALEDWYGLSINSGSNETIYVESDSSAFRIIFRRWGHGIGMSQRGAQRMASEYGKSYRQILDFYYPGTTLKSVSLSATGAHASVKVAGEVIANAVALDGAQMRSGASEGAELRAELSAGVELDVYELNEEWAAVAVRGLTGFVLRSQLSGLPEVSPSPSPSATPEPSPSATPEPSPSATPEITATPAPTATATPAPTATATPAPTATTTIAPTATATVRPTATATIAPTATATIAPTATATVAPTATATPAPTATATIAPTATATVAPTATATIAPTATATVSPTATATIAPTAMATVRPTATLPALTASPTMNPPTLAPQPTVADRPMPTPVPAPEGAEGMLVATDTLYAYVNVAATSSLTVRKAASTSAAPVTYLYRGAQVRLLAFNDDWAYIRTASGQSGFASRRYLYLPGNDSGSQPVAQDTPKQEENKQEENKQETQGKKFREIKTDVTFCNITARTTTRTKMYKSYSTSSAVLGTLPASAKVKVGAYNREWAYVSFGSYKGFVQLKDLKAE